VFAKLALDSELDALAHEVQHDHAFAFLGKMRGEDDVAHKLFEDKLGRLFLDPLPIDRILDPLAGGITGGELIDATEAIFLAEKGCVR
jgi:hypothetical protein